ncbi:uncharacterized protein LOC134527188 isoform X3 [Bacillus rossius redtenbacheri]|uniref:uncharacterized protein LOC134527188 isoform X3 n=1 Tax=Bacillus rossius redtenbacheri TaxID=93214 RepID=UPI002FDE1E58
MRELYADQVYVWLASGDKGDGEWRDMELIWIVRVRRQWQETVCANRRERKYRNMDENLNDSDILKKTDSIQVSSQVDETSPETVSNSKSFPETELEERAQPTKQAKDDSESGLDLQERADVVMTEDKEGACSNSTHCSIERPKKEKNLSKTDSVFILSSDDEKEAGDSTKESDRPITESEVDMFSSHLNDTQVQMQSESMDYGDMIPSSQEDSAEDVSSAHISNKRLDDGTSRIPQGKRKLENVDEPECKMLCVEKHPSPNEQRTPAQFPKSDVTSHRKEADSNTDFEPAIRKNSKVIEESESEDDMSDRKDDSKNFSEDMETIEKDKTMKKSYKIHLLHEINAEKGNTRDEKISLNVADDKTGLTNVDNQAISAVNNVSGAEIAGEGSLSGKTLSNTQMLNTNKCESKQFQLNFDPKTKINSDSPSLLGDAKLDTSETYDDTQDILEFNNKISNVADMDSTELDNSPVMTESDMFAPDEVMETDVSEHGRSSASVADTVVQTDMAQSESKGKSNTDDCVETEMPKLNLGTKSVSLSQNVELDVLELDNKCNVLNLNEVTLSKSHVCADSTSKSEDTSEGSKTSQLNAVISEALKVEKGISETSKEDDVTSEAFKLCDALPKAIKTDNKTEVTQPEGVIPKVSKYNVSKSEFEGSQSKDTILEYSKSVLVSEASKLEDDTGPTKLETVVLYSSKSDDISNSGKSENVPDTGSSESASGEGKSDVSSSDDTVITHSSQSSDMRPCDQKSDHINYADITKSDLEKTAFKNSDKLGTDLLNSSELKSKLSELNEVSSDSSAKYNTVKLDNAKNLKLSESSLLVEEVTVEPEVVAQKSKKYLEDKRVFSEKYSSSPIKHVEVNFVHPKTTPSKSSKYLGRVIEDDEFDADGSRKSNDLDVSDSQDLTLCISLSPNTSTQSADDVQLEKRSLKSQYSQHDKEMDIVEVSPETLKERKSEEQNSKLPTFEKASSDSILSNGFADTHEVMVCCSSDNKISDLDSTASRNSIVIIRERDNCPVRKKEDTSTSPVKRKRLNDNSDVIELVDITETPPQPEDTHHKKKLRTLENEEKMSFTSPELSIMETNTSSIDVAESSFENEAISLSGKAAALKDDTTIMYRKEDITCKMKIVYKKHTKEVLSATVVQCELKGDQFRVPRRSSDLSPGYMADSDGKTSPGSVTSTGPYALIPKQMSRFSTVSSSSSGSNFGSFNGNGEPPKDCNTFKLPPVEKMKERYLFRDDNLEKNGHQIFSTPGSLTRNYNLMIQILDQIAVVDNFNISDSGYNEDYESKKSGSNFTDTNGHSKTERDVKPFAAENGTPKSTRKSQVRVAKQSVSKVKVISDSKEEKSPSVVDSGEKPVDSDLAARSPQVGRSGRRARNNLDLEARRSPAQSATRSKTPGSSDRKAAHSGTGRRKTGSEKGSLETQAVENPKMPEVYEKPSRPETPKKDSVSSEPRTPEAIDGVRGASVFARWTDRKYYSGKVKNKVQRDKWLVEFDDGNSKPLIQDFIIVCTELNRGQSVYAMNRHGEFLSGVIKDFKLSKGEVVYGVELDDTEEQLFVPRSKISLSEDQASLLRESVYDTSFTCLTPKSLSAVTLDNLVEGKRVRKLQAHLERPQTSGTLSNLKPRRARSDASSLSDAGDKASSASEFVEGVDPESYPSVELVVTKGKRKSKPKVSEDPDIVSLLGPIPPEGSNIFAAGCFLLTCSDIDYHVHTAAKRRTPTGKKGKKMSSDEYSELSSSSDTNVSATPFDKNRLTKQLTAGGGVVYENFSDVPENKYTSCKLIANKTQQTAKYLLCLAHNIPIVQHKWVIESVKQGSMEECSGYYLHAGWSLEDGMYKEWKISPRTSRKPLQDLSVYIVNEAGIFFKFWNRILTALGASATHLVDCQDLASKPDVILTDLSCLQEVIQKAELYKIPLVSTTWVVQCLINWRRCGYNAHVKYRYNAPD